MEKMEINSTTIIQKISIEVTLERLLIETVRNGVKYAHLKQKAGSIPERHAAHEGMAAAADILSSILPAVCPAQVQDAFESITEEAIFPYGRISMKDVEKVIDIAKAW